MLVALGALAGWGGARAAAIAKAGVEYRSKPTTLVSAASGPYEASLAQVTRLASRATEPDVLHLVRVRHIETGRSLSLELPASSAATELSWTDSTSLLFTGSEMTLDLTLK